jgi:hypothetical protein
MGWVVLERGTALRGIGQCDDVPQVVGEACRNGGVHGMDIRETLRILRRRWYVTGPLLLLTVAASAVLAARSGPYQSESQVVLLPSAQSAKAAGGNPYLSFDDSLTLTADLLRRQLIAPPVVQSLGRNGYRSPYQVVDDPLTVGPVLDITVTGSSKSSVEHTLAGVTHEAGRQLRVMQGDVAPIDRITLRTVSYAPKPSLLAANKARTPVVALAVGLVLTLAVPLTFDAAMADRRKAGSRARSPRRPAIRAATIAAAARTLARVQLKLGRTGADGRGGTTPDGVPAGRPADDWQQLLADPGHGRRSDQGQPVAADGNQDSTARRSVGQAEQ